MTDVTSVEPLLTPIRARLEAASDGPWEFIGNDLEQCSPGYGVVIENGVDCMSYCYGGSIRSSISPANKALIENAPTDVAALLAAVQGVLALHVIEFVEDEMGDDTGVNRCAECLYEQEDDEPCPTVAAIAAALEGEGEG